MNNLHYNSETREIREQVDKSLSQTLMFVNRAFKLYLKSYFERNLADFLDKKIELRLVVDTNIIVQELLSYAKSGKSFLLDLADSPFLSLYAPSALKEEIREHLSELARKTKSGEDEILRIFETLFLPKINILNLVDESSWERGREIIGNRDRKDIPFVSLCLYMGVHGILTRDKDMLEQPELRTWERPGSVGKIVTLFEKGSLSFFVTSTAIPAIFKLLLEIGTVIIRAVWGAIQLVARLIIGLISGAIKSISKLSPWLQTLMGFGIIVLLTHEKTRDKVIGFVKEVGKMLAEFLQNMYEILKSLIEKIASLLSISLVVFSYLFENVQKTVTTLQQIEDK